MLFAPNQRRQTLRSGQGTRRLRSKLAARKLQPACKCVARRTTDACNYEICASKPTHALNAARCGTLPSREKRSELRANLTRAILHTRAFASQRRHVHPQCSASRKASTKQGCDTSLPGMLTPAFRLPCVLLSQCAVVKTNQVRHITARHVDPCTPVAMCSSRYAVVKTKPGAAHHRCACFHRLCTSLALPRPWHDNHVSRTRP